MGKKLTKRQLAKLHADHGGQAKGLNVRTKKMEVIKNPQLVTTKNGRKAIRGVGSDGTPIFRFVKG